MNEQCEVQEREKLGDLMSKLKENHRGHRLYCGKVCMKVIVINDKYKLYKLHYVVTCLLPIS